jgi:SAM-dependent methyltransferase
MPAPPRIFPKLNGRRMLRALALAGIALAAVFVLAAALNFPYDVDAPLSTKALAASRAYYAEAYRKPTAAQERGTSEYETKYLRVAKAAAEANHVTEKVQDFVARFNLHARPVLEIGSGRGYLQDLAEDYTGLDISPSVSRFYHKKFVLASATAMPFPDNSFDGAWSIWVLEHIPGPEHALREMRRVVRNGGVIFLYPAWNCKRWAADGYDVRPYSDFGLAGQTIKASIPFRSSRLFDALKIIPNRILRTLASAFSGPTALHCRRLTPNYETYWEADSDAVNSIDKYEVMLWFRTRGDECLNCPPVAQALFSKSAPLIIRVHKCPRAIP